MIILLSPSKTLDFESEKAAIAGTDLLFGKETAYLAAKMKLLKPAKIAKMMDLSDNLSRLNFERYQLWRHPFGDSQSRHCVYAFKGDVYLGLEAELFNDEDMAFAQKHLCILSGLYGILRPLDEILPYRLEMGTDFNVTPKKKSLYSYWKPRLTAYTKIRLGEQNSGWILNLASQEYAKAIDLKGLKVPVITPDFKEERAGEFQMISFFAKKARGLMAAFAIKNRIENPKDLLNFDAEGYGMNASLSDLKTNKWVFTRKSR
jgi:cytoplasmic iron level regulating protein YaaA (DUF328/UPF0246 family)